MLGLNLSLLSRITKPISAKGCISRMLLHMRVPSTVNGVLGLNLALLSRKKAHFCFSATGHAAKHVWLELRRLPQILLVLVRHTIN